MVRERFVAYPTPLRLVRLVARAKVVRGLCIRCGKEAELHAADTNWGLINLCVGCLHVAREGLRNRQPRKRLKKRKVKDDMLFHVVSGSVFTRKGR